MTTRTWMRLLAGITGLGARAAKAKLAWRQEIDSYFDFAHRRGVDRETAQTILDEERRKSESSRSTSQAAIDRAYRRLKAS